MTALDLPLAQEDAVALLTRQTGILERIAVGGPLVGVLTDVATTYEDLVPGSHCSVLLLDRVAGTLRHGAAPTLPTDYSAHIDGMAIGPDAGSCGTAAHTGLPVVADDIRSDPRWARYRSLADAAGLRACWSTPIRGRDGVCGTFAVYHHEPHLPSAREELLVARLTHLASVAIDHDAVVGALAVSEERFRRAFEDNAVGMALTTPQGEVTRVNHALVALLGRPEDELVGAALDDVVVPLAPRRRGARHEEYDATAGSPGGGPLDLVVAASPIMDARGLPRALSVNVLDVTAARAAERERRARAEAEVAAAAAESANRAKTDFVTALGHELRTPLQAITGFTELLATLDLPPDRRAEALRHIGGAAEHILTMVADVLDVSRIETRSLPLSLRDVPVEPVVADVLAMVAPLAAAERVTLHTAPMTTTVLVHADERRVRQILLNLVTNALRYHRPGGRVLVGWSVDEGQVRITVRDNGPGIAREHLGRLFVPFDRLGRDADGGVGLGLPLARGLTEAMAGSLEVHSTPGVGTTVCVDLPAGRG
ncbi:GAF domain-containing sensor histidine kinase [Lapillicoccus jejuensis]|uniref:histidine kinase n=1 Tax=Lapillicoccus jejuensis TaxID=402171 RepID=A0A542E0R3_9MICO|nr:ATP-binding protein [Lapillicoccus jejuensis]TQJ08784.1 PAS domain S-box-containing protein [Lapillicoccus jejuensis]